MKRLRVNPVGIVEHPVGYRASAGVYPLGVRVAAVIVLATFASVTIATTAFSLGTYCLTSGNGPITLLGF